MGSIECRSYHSKEAEALALSASLALKKVKRNKVGSFSHFCRYAVLYTLLKKFGISVPGESHEDFE